MIFSMGKPQWNGKPAKRNRKDACENGKETVSGFHLLCWKGIHRFALSVIQFVEIIGDKGPMRVRMISSVQVLRNGAMLHRR